MPNNRDVLAERLYKYCDRVYVFDYYRLVNFGSIDKIEAACNQLRQALSAE